MPSQTYYPVVTRQAAAQALLAAAQTLGYPPYVVFTRSDNGFDAPTDVWAASGLKEANDPPGGGTVTKAAVVATGLAPADIGAATPAQITAAVNNLINGAPGALDTLHELADAMGDDPNFAATVTNALAGKAVPADITAAIANEVTRSNAAYAPSLPPGAVQTAQTITAAAGSTVLVDASSRIVPDGAFTSGQATVTSATAAFTDADIGKVVSGTLIPANTTILSRNSATSVVLSANTTGSGAQTAQGLVIGDGPRTVNIPGAPNDGDTVEVKKLDATANQVVINSGTVPIDVIGGSTSATLTGRNHGVTLRYRQALGVWVGRSHVPIAVANSVAVPAYAGTRSNRFDAVRGTYNWKRSNTQQLRQSLALASSSLRTWLFIGDSKTAGVGAVANQTDGRLSWPGQISRLLALQGIPIAGQFIPARVNGFLDPRLAYAGTWAGTTSADTNRLSHAATATASGSTQTVTSDIAGTAVDTIMSQNSGAFSLSVNGGAATNVSPTNNSTVIRFTLAQAIAVGQTVVATTTSATATSLFGTVIRNATGLLVVNLGIGSSKSTDWRDTTFSSAGPYSLSTNAWQNVAAVFIQLTTNDQRNNAVPLATTKANLAATIAEHKALGRDVILVTDTPYVGADAKQLAVHAMRYDLADQFDLPLFDMCLAAQGFALPNATWSTDGLHETAAGYLVEALGFVPVLTG